MDSHGNVEIDKALEVNVEFDLSRQLWTYLVKKRSDRLSGSFIHPVPHLSFVRGADNVAFLKKRHAALTAHHTYEGMQYSDDRQKIKEWVPLVMEGRAADEAVAATYMPIGADVNYGALTHDLLGYLKTLGGFAVAFQVAGETYPPQPDGRWDVTVEDMASGVKRTIRAKFVFLGAGGRFALAAGFRDSRSEGLCRLSP